MSNFLYQVILKINNDMSWDPEIKVLNQRSCFQAMTFINDRVKDEIAVFHSEFEKGNISEEDVLRGVSTPVFVDSILMGNIKLLDRPISRWQTLKKLLCQDFNRDFKTRTKDAFALYIGYLGNKDFYSDQFSVKEKLSKGISNEQMKIKKGAVHLKSLQYRFIETDSNNTKIDTEDQKSIEKGIELEPDTLSLKNQTSTGLSEMSNILVREGKSIIRKLDMDYRNKYDSFYGKDTINISDAQTDEMEFISKLHDILLLRRLSLMQISNLDGYLGFAVSWRRQVMIVSVLGLSIINGWNIEKIHLLVRFSLLRKRPILQERAIIGLVFALILFYDNDKYFLEILEMMSPLQKEEYHNIYIKEALNFLILIAERKINFTDSLSPEIFEKWGYDILEPICINSFDSTENKPFFDSLREDNDINIKINEMIGFSISEKQDVIERLRQNKRKSSFVLLSQINSDSRSEEPVNFYHYHKLKFYQSVEKFWHFSIINHENVRQSEQFQNFIKHLFLKFKYYEITLLLPNPWVLEDIYEIEYYLSYIKNSLLRARYHKASVVLLTAINNLSNIDIIIIFFERYFRYEKPKFERRDISKIIDIIDCLTSIKNNNDYLLFTKAKILISQNNYAKAFKVLKNAISIAPRKSEYLNCAFELIQNLEVETGLRDIFHIYPKTDENMSFLVRKVYDFFSIKNMFKEIICFCDLILGSEQSKIDALLGKMLSFFELKEYNEVLRIVKSYKDHFPQQFDVNYLEGYVYFMLKKYQMAKSCFSISNEQNDKFILAHCECLLGNIKEAYLIYFREMKKYYPFEMDRFIQEFDKSVDEVEIKEEFSIKKIRKYFKKYIHKEQKDTLYKMLDLLSDRFNICKNKELLFFFFDSAVDDLPQHEKRGPTNEHLKHKAREFIKIYCENKKRETEI